MELEVGDKPFDQRKERKRAREQTERDQRASHQFDEPADPKLRSRGRHEMDCATPESSARHETRTWLLRRCGALLDIGFSPSRKFPDSCH